MTAYDIYVKGRVQGVGYRYFIKRIAQEFGVTGYVKNLKSGEVLIHGEAEKNVLEYLLEYCKIGPKHSDVKTVNYQEVPTESYKTFEITY